MPPSSLFTVEGPAEAAAAAASPPSDPPQTVLDNAPIEAGRVHAFVARGRTLKNTIHPLLAHGEAWVAERVLNARSQSSFLVAPPPLLPLRKFPCHRAYLSG